MLRRIGGAAETVFCFLALSIFLGAYTTVPPRLQGIEYGGGDSNPFNAAAMSLVLIGTIILVSAHWRSFLSAASQGGAVNLFVILAIASVLWSDYPEISARRSLTLLQAVAFGYYLAARFPVDQVVRLVASVLAVALVGSALLALALPEAGIMQEAELAGAWSGVFAHKSALGGATIMGTLCFGWLWVREPRRRVLYTLGILLCLFMVVMSRSATAHSTIALLAAIAACLPFFRLPGLTRIWAVYGMLVVFIGLGAILFFFFGEIMEAVGKDPTLTGRVPIWSSLLELALRHPIGGYGYNAFFVAENPDVEDVWRWAGWRMWSAHNTFIEMLLQLGIPGVAISTWALAVAVRRSLRAWSDGMNPWAGFAVVYILSFVVTSCVETVMFRSGDMHSVLFPLLYVALRIDAGRTARARADAPWPEHRLDPLYQTRR